jgi:hypothetical protein
MTGRLFPEAIARMGEVLKTLENSGHPIGRRRRRLRGSPGCYLAPQVDRAVEGALERGCFSAKSCLRHQFVGVRVLFTCVCNFYGKRFFQQEKVPIRGAAAKRARVINGNPIKKAVRPTFSTYDLRYYETMVRHLAFSLRVRMRRREPAHNAWTLVTGPRWCRGRAEMHTSSGPRSAPFSSPFFPGSMLLFWNARFPSSFVV